MQPCSCLLYTCEYITNHAYCTSQIDYFERAKRLEEIPQLNKEYEAHREADSQFFEEQEQERVSWK